MITVFTPTYNRSYIIANLYNSLCRQTFFDFEWLVIDDGSTDNTEELIASFESEKKIYIRYIKQDNGGKHRAINRGLKEAKGELFFIVDSDDCLVENSLERIYHYYNQIKDDPFFIGVCGLKAYFTGERVGGEVDMDVIDCTSLDVRLKYHVRGDLAEVFKTNILKQFPFPEIPGELFCSEGLVWNRIAREYKMRFFFEKIYLCDYLPDGLTSKIVKIRMQSPVATKLLYSELYRMDVPLKMKLKAALNYWRFSFCMKSSFKNDLLQMNALSLFLYPLGYIMHMRDKEQL